MKKILVILFFLLSVDVFALDINIDKAEKINLDFVESDKQYELSYYFKKDRCTDAKVNVHEDIKQISINHPDDKDCAAIFNFKISKTSNLKLKLHQGFIKINDIENVLNGIQSLSASNFLGDIKRTSKKIKIEGWFLNKKASYQSINNDKPSITINVKYGEIYL